MTQFLGHKADLGCSRCKFRAEREPGSVGASGKMSYFTPVSSQSRIHDQVVEDNFNLPLQKQLLLLLQKQMEFVIFKEYLTLTLLKCQLATLIYARKK